MNNMKLIRLLLFPVMCTFYAVFPCEPKEESPDAQGFYELIQKVRKILPQATGSSQWGGNVKAMIVQPGTTLVQMSDLHGGALSLRENLDRLKDKKLMCTDTFDIPPHCCYVFGGDHGDRGPNSVDVWNALLHFICKKPDQVFLLRGNHEEEIVAEQYSLKDEIERKFADQAQQIWKELMLLFDQLPQTLLVSCNKPHSKLHEFGWFVHAGIDKRLTGPLKRVIEGVIVKKMQEDSLPSMTTEYFENIPAANGLTWSDFYANQPDVPSRFIRKTRPSTRGAQGVKDYTKYAVIGYLKKNLEQTDPSKPFQYKVNKGIYRGHQHVPGGVVELNDEAYCNLTWKKLNNEERYPVKPYSVFTCTSSSESFEGEGCRENAFAVIEINQNGDWFITPHIEQR